MPNDKNFFGLHFAALISIQWKEILLKEHFYFHAPALSCYIHEDACYKTTRIPNWQKNLRKYRRKNETASLEMMSPHCDTHNVWCNENRTKALVKHYCAWFDFYCIRRYLGCTMYIWVKFSMIKKFKIDFLWKHPSVLWHN